MLTFPWVTRSVTNRTAQTRITFTLLATLFVITAAHAQTPLADLAKPPADAVHFTISSTDGKHGDSWIWRRADGAWMGRESMHLRG